MQQAALTTSPLVLQRSRNDSHQNQIRRIQWTQDIISANQAVLVSLLFSFSPQVTSNDKTPTVISSALEKHIQDPKQASRYELIQLLPEGKGKDNNTYWKCTLYF